MTPRLGPCLARVIQRIMLLAGSVLLISCASPHYREATTLFREGHIDEGLVQLKIATDENPTDVPLRSEYLAKLTARTNSLLTQAQTARQQSHLDQAQTLYEQILKLNPQDSPARDGLIALHAQKLQSMRLKEAHEALKGNNPAKALVLVRGVLDEDPDNPSALALKQQLDELANQSASQRLMGEVALSLPINKPVNLEFRDANAKFVFDALGRTTGVNFILDRDVRPDLLITVSLRNATMEEAIRLILQTQQLEYKVLNKNSVFVYPATPEKLKNHQELVVKAFYMKNADVKQVQSNLKTMLKSKDTVIDEKLNLLVMRDTPDAVQLADKLIAMHDISEPEVMLEVEVLEIDRAKALNLGIQWPTGATFTPLASNASRGLTVSDLKSSSLNSIGVSTVTAGVNANASITDANILANPRIRVRNRESAKIMIGDKLPVITSNITPTGVVSSNVQYLDVGLKLDVQPDIRLNHEIGMKLELEVSSITNTVTLANGTQTYQIGTRNASSKLRLHDGETQILGGLISNQERTSGSRIPGIGELPVLNRIFGSQSDSQAKSELVLSITPRLVRGFALPPSDRTEFWSGTEAVLRNPRTFTASNDKPERDTKRPDTEVLTQDSAHNVALAWKVKPLSVADKTYVVNLVANADGLIRSLPVQIGFDPGALQVMSVEEGRYFNREGAPTTFVQGMDRAHGKVFATITRNDHLGATPSDEPLMSFKVKVLAEQTASIQVLLAEPVVPDGTHPAVALPAPYPVMNANPDAGQQ